ncbi:hypothetical protein NP493_334g03022 [Ridgeia piscesae]|uniref:Uncharacterized protein n=1 Tax=Ridgeia piscesae TaxID=27915 RepID=A0AAD9L3T1_RIDPI|nr:hypothetical protein NP493_334g03022 [Ridgeia piscesae]
MGAADRYSPHLRRQRRGDATGHSPTLCVNSNRKYSLNLTMSHSRKCWRRIYNLVVSSKVAYRNIVTTHVDHNALFNNGCSYYIIPWRSYISDWEFPDRIWLVLHHALTNVREKCSPLSCAFLPVQ